MERKKKQWPAKQKLPYKLGMLVLARTLKEPVFILCPTGEKIEITIEEIRGSTVRIGFIAPREYDIVRHDARDHNNKKFMKTEPKDA